jgi:hypothetical protein
VVDLTEKVRKEGMGVRIVRIERSVVRKEGRKEGL